jgi:hypothetical protein
MEACSRRRHASSQRTLRIAGLDPRLRPIAIAPLGARLPIRSTRRPGSASGPRRAGRRFPWARSFPPRSPPRTSPLCSTASQVLRPRPRILIRVHAHRSAVAFMSRSGLPGRTRIRPPRFRTKDVSTCMGSPTARGSSSPGHSSARILPSLKRTRSAPGNSTRFAARYPARGFPCERFKLSLAASPCTLGAGAAD